MYVMKIAPGRAPKIVPCDCSLKDLQTLVGGYIETIPLVRDYRLVVPGATMIVNEEGKLQNLHYNPVATRIVSLFDGDHIVGTAVVVKAIGEEIVGLDDAEADELASFMEYDLNIEVDVEGKR